MHPLLFGLGGTAALMAWAGARNRLFGGPPIYSARTLVKRAFGVSGRSADVLAQVVRLGYGTTLAVAWHRLRPTPGAGIGLGIAVLALELVSFPVLGLTPPVRQWPTSDKLLLPVQTLLFGAVVEALRR
ncbi:MAG: hypothetical protein ACK4N5_13845 [Myxococcales bacterium]